MNSSIQRIQQRLQQTLQPSVLTVEDEGHLHRGHANEGKGHFAITIASPLFAGKNLLQCHKMVYNALSDLMNTDIHALKIKVVASGED
ncbi:MAG: BolA family protein [Gammaproteobacteria bacterium]